MVIRIPTPGDVLDVAKSTVGFAVDSATTVVAVPKRVLNLIEGAESVLNHAQDVANRADQLITRTTRTVEDAEGLVRDVRTVADAATAAVTHTERITHGAESLVSRAGQVCDEAASTVSEVRGTAATADQLLETYAPLAHRAAPLAKRFVDELSQAEVDAAIRLVDELPVLTEHVLTDILPILRTLDRVGPEIHELLEVTHDVRRAIVGIPGFRFFRRRGEERVSEEASGNAPSDQGISDTNGKLH